MRDKTYLCLVRCHPSDVLDLGAGVELRVEPGDVVEVGQEWAIIHHNRDIPKQLLSGLYRNMFLKTETLNMF